MGAALAPADRQKPSTARAWLFGIAQAIGMACLARLCLMGSEALFSQLELARGMPWWTGIPGWLALAWLGKRSAAAGWWRVQGAWIFGGVALGLHIVWIAVSVGVSPGWLAACLWAAMWPFARAKAVAAAASADRSEESGAAP